VAHNIRPDGACREHLAVAEAETARLSARCEKLDRAK
jgi:hypothetical protein